MLRQGVSLLARGTLVSLVVKEEDVAPLAVVAGYAMTLLILDERE